MDVVVRIKHQKNLGPLSTRLDKNCPVFNEILGETPKKGRPLKGYKVSLVKDRNRICGLAAADFPEFQRKVKLKFYLKNVFVFLPDGTEVDDDCYFQSLPNQSRVLVAEKREEWKNNQVFGITQTSPLLYFLQAVRRATGASQVGSDIHSYFQEDGMNKIQQIVELIKEKEKRTEFSSREDDKYWFKGLSTNAKTKEEFMTKNCQGRIRGYLAKAESQVKDAKLTDSQAAQAKDVFYEFRAKLKENGFHGSYFNRGVSNKSQRICDKRGTFICEGRYDLEHCKFVEKCENSNENLATVSKLSNDHSINPYESPESRILFSTWNLDHIIEKSRTVIPALISTIRDTDDKRKVNSDYFYCLLFTRANLKLVHIVCHDKQEHKGKECEESNVFTIL